MWDPSPDSSVAGYMVYVRMPGASSNVYDVGKVTSFDWNGAVNGQQYYLSVAAYSPGPVIGPRSGEVSRYPDLPPTLANPGPQTANVSTSVELQLSGNDPEGGTLTYGATGLPPGVQLTPSTGRISGSPTTVGSYVVTASVSDSGLSDAETFTWTILGAGTPPPPPPPAPAPPPDEGEGGEADREGGEAPSSNLAPTLTEVGAQTSTRGIGTSLQLQGSDPEGAALTYGAGGLPPGLLLAASTGRISGTPTTSGNYVVTATISDGARSDAKTFEWRVIESVFDTTPPVVSVTLPTTEPTFTTDRSFVTLGGTAFDEGRIREVLWVSDRGVKGKATGLENWIAGVPIYSGTNTITIRAHDEAGNVSSRTVVVKTKPFWRRR